MLNSCRCRAWTIASRRGRRPWPRLSRSRRRRPTAIAPTIFSFKVACRTRGFCWRISFRDRGYFMKGPQPRQPGAPSCAMEPDRRLRQALLCAGLVSIELEDANADPNHSGGCGAGARRLQRQSGGQSLVAAALPGLRRPLRGLQSLRSHQLRTEQHRARWRPLRAGSATAGWGGEALSRRHDVDPFGFSWGLPIWLRKPRFMTVGFPWISLDSLVRIETYQWVTRDFPRKIFLEPYLGARSAGKGACGPGHSEGLDCSWVKLTSISDCQQAIVARPVSTSRAIEPDRQVRQTLLCAGLVSIELEDANADPDHSGFCDTRALWLQRQSGDQSLRTGEQLRE